MLELANIDKTAVGGVIPINSSSPVYKLVAGNMSTTLSWIVLVVALVLVCNANRGLITPLRGVPWVAGLIYESRLGSMSVDIDGGQLVLYAVAAAVIGGTSSSADAAGRFTPCLAAS
jgi:hypothetical protein